MVRISLLANYLFGYIQLFLNNSPFVIGGGNFVGQTEKIDMWKQAGHPCCDSFFNCCSRDALLFM